jgi:SAM-dependent methyltransferase
MAFDADGEPNGLASIYRRRFAGAEDYRMAVWGALVDRYFAPRFLGNVTSVLDLGAGYGEFIRNVDAPHRYAMDLSTDVLRLSDAGVTPLLQDCAAEWPLDRESLDLVFSSNLLEHLPDKAAVESTLRRARDHLRPGGRLVLLGPNIRHLPGRYWDYWDHHIPLTDRSIAEVVAHVGFRDVHVIPRFLPYTMSDGRRVPLWAIVMYLRIPVAWRLLGRQFLVTATR